jgi:5-methylcytosine-specific restriction endonuclease McrA
VCDYGERAGEAGEDERVEGVAVSERSDSGNGGSSAPTRAQRYAPYYAQRANLLKQQLIEFLGGQCEECGATHDLQVNHIYQRDWTPRKVTHYRRVLRYWKEALAGDVNLLCEACNAVYRPLPREEREAGSRRAVAPF